ncbi:MAG: alpha-L-fucosidase [Tannerella sp.]|jgi:alpha-L-fucosidase|nr:alpha-L-fucosidase [Tannerella sp.]
MRKKIILLLSGFLFTQIQAQVENNKFQSTIKVDANDTKEIILEKAAHVIPTPNQLDALKNEFIAFVHFGPNTFTQMEWGNGMEDPKVFDLKELDTDQWCEAMKAAGMKMVILTAKHHDGFVLWQSRYTKHGIMSTNFRDGKGDILKDLSESCHKYGIKLAVYLSPADLFQIESPEGLYGNLSEYTSRTIPREVPGRPFANKTTFEFVVDDYNEYFLNQLFELLTEYGPIHEVWFDGAHPKRKGGQKYNFLAWRQLIRKLAPEAVIFGKEDIRWCGNEGGATRDTEWNVIPYGEDPNTMNDFKDLTDYDLGSNHVLLNKEKPYYLHYQPAETNTSIREGWFYREDTYQKVRSADNVFDIYERSVGGNSIFLLNIPPNREGRFPERDVNVLKEVGKRIHETYQVNLFDKATGPKEVLDNDMSTYTLLDKQPQEIIISTPKPVTINRLVIQEAIATHGERVIKHAVDAYIDGSWKEIAKATNIGYRRILRFPEVTTSQIRIRILESRMDPAICNVSAYYYATRPPMLTSTRDMEGLVTIEPIQADFNWNRNEHNSSKNLNAGYTIYYTTDGTEPNASSAEYKEPFRLENGELKAVSMLNGELGPVHQEQFGWIKKDWQIIAFSSESQRRKAAFVYDEDPVSYWMTEESEDVHFISLDLGKEQTIKGFAYTPQRDHADGMLEKGIFQISGDGKTWKDADTFEFGNLINDPAKRTYYFKNSVKTRYIRIEATSIAANGKVLSIAELDLF